MDNEKIDKEQLPELDELMPGEDLHYTRPPDHEDFMDYDLRTKEIFMGEDIRKKAARTRMVLRTKELLVLVSLFAIVYLYILSTERLPWKLALFTVITPLPYGVLMRMVSNKMDLQEALRNSKPYFVLTALNLIGDIVIFFLIR